MEDAGRFDDAEKLRKAATKAEAIAEDLAEYADKLHKNPPKGMAERAAQFEQARREWTMRAAEAHPDLSKQGSVLQATVAGMLHELSRTDPQLMALPSVTYHATRMAALQLERQALAADAARVPVLEKEVGGLKAKVKELESLTSPGSSTSVAKLGSSSPEDGEAELERMAREMGTLR